METELIFTTSNVIEILVWITCLLIFAGLWYLIFSLVRVTKTKEEKFTPMTPAEKSCREALRSGGEIERDTPGYKEQEQWDKDERHYSEIHHHS